MRRALDVAVAGRGRVEPNPVVGCVIVRNGQVLGEGRHEIYGGPHAEPNALQSLLDNNRRSFGATAYVTLEPCCHTDKQTPPCVPQLIAAKLARVVIGCADPHPSVSGAGVAQLKAAGLKVTLGVLEDEARQLIAPFYARTRLGRPYVTLKWAVSADDKVAGRMGTTTKITNNSATAAVHALRGRCDAVAVATNTVRNDDPLLTARTPDPPRKPLRVVFSNRLTLPPEAKLFHTPQGGPVVVYAVDAAASGVEASALRKKGVEVVGLPATQNGRGGERFSLADAYADLAGRGVTHLLIEPGPKLVREVLKRDQADRAWIFRGQGTVGPDGLPAPACDWPEVASLNLDGDVLGERLNPASDAYFAPAASADFALTTAAKGQ